MSRSKYTVQEKLDLVLEFKETQPIFNAFVRENNLVRETFSRWIRLFDRDGIDGLTERRKNNKYPLELKLRVVKDYLEGKDSLNDLTIKYGLRNKAQVSDWLIKYNNGKLLMNDSSGKKHSIMKKKITFEERIKVVEYIVKGKHTYKEAAEQYSVSYQQARSWVIKFKNGGFEALKDGRGHHHNKSDEDLTELDKANLKIKELEAQLKDQKLIEEFAKKLQEIRRRG